MFDDEESSVFEGTKAELATKHAKHLHDAELVLKGWKRALDKMPEDTSEDKAKVQDCIDAVDEAVELMEELYPQLAVHAALLQLREDHQASGELEAEDDHTYL